MVDGVVSTRTSNEVGRNRHRLEFSFDVLQRAAFGASVRELALKAEVGGGIESGHPQRVHTCTAFGVDDKITGWSSFPTRAQAFAHAGLKETV